MTSYDVDVDELAAVVATMAACEGALAHEAAGLESAHRRLHTSWSGRASDAHVRSHARWQAGFEEMATALAALRSLGDVARANYSAAAEANLEMWRRAT